MIPSDLGKFENKGADKANKRTCMFDANIFMKTNICPQFNITILKSWSTK